MSYLAILWIIEFYDQLFQIEDFETVHFSCWYLSLQGSFEPEVTVGARRPEWLWEARNLRSADWKDRCHRLASIGPSLPADQSESSTWRLQSTDWVSFWTVPLFCKRKLLEWATYNCSDDVWYMATIMGRFDQYKPGEVLEKGVWNMNTEIWTSKMIQKINYSFQCLKFLMILSHHLTDGFREEFILKVPLLKDQCCQ